MTPLFLLCSCFALTAASPLYGRLTADTGNAFPFQAAIFKWIVGTFHDTFVCDGVLISDRYILTAASCIDGVDYFKGIVKVVVGRRHENPNILTQQGFMTTQFKIHEEFQRDNLKNNIAILRLMGFSVVSFNDYVKAATLPTSSEVENNYIGKSANVSTWDWEKIPSALPPILYYTTSTVIDNNSCIDKNTTSLVDDTVLCAVNENRSCRNAPGSPLSVNNEVIGLQSWVHPVGCQSMGPTGFVKINEYLDWIKTKIAEFEPMRELSKPLI